MFKKQSLKTRLTIIVGIVLILISGLLTFFSIKNIDRNLVKPQLNSLVVRGTYIGEDGVLRFSEMVIDGPKEIIGLPGNTRYAYIEKNMLRDSILESQEKTSRFNIYSMLTIVVVGIGLAYVCISKTLEPLRDLSMSLESIDENNLKTKIDTPDTEDEVASLISSFNNMLSRLEIMFNEQKDFSAKAAHELKTPLTTMKTSLQVLQLDDSPSIEDYKENIELTENHIDRLIDIVNNLFLLSSDKIELNDNIRIKDLVYSSVDRLETDIVDKNIYVDINLKDLNISGNEELLNSVFYNLISNGVKYNKVEGYLKIYDEIDGDYLSIIFEDSGIGIKEEELDKIFDSFYRSEEVSDYKGNGLGLSIVKSIVSDHNGKIIVNSKANSGSKFIIKLPKKIIL